LLAHEPSDFADLLDEYLLGSPVQQLDIPEHTFSYLCACGALHAWNHTVGAIEPGCPIQSHIEPLGCIASFQKEDIGRVVAQGVQIIYNASLPLRRNRLISIYMFHVKHSIVI
jgi:hypothetical protein